MSDRHDTEGFTLNPPRDEACREGMGGRVLHMLLIWAMLSLAQTVLTLATFVQLVLMLVNRGVANPRLADFGTDLGIWVAKAARYQTGASDVKPWPWTELD
ncbi:MAG: DUF4389 domain-containing protein [Shimia sp.]